MRNNDANNRAYIGMLLKVFGVLYLVFFGYGFVKEYLFTRTDSHSHTIGIIVGIAVLLIAVPIVISMAKGFKKTRRRVQKNLTSRPMYNESAVNPNAKKPQHTGNTKNRGRGKRR